MFSTPLFKKILRWVGYSLLSMLTFYFVFNLLMDWDLLKERIETELENSTGYQVKISDISLGLSSIKMNDVLLREDNPPEDKKRKIISIDTVSLDASIFDLLQKKQSFSLKLEVFGGDVYFSYNKEDETQKFNFELEKLKLSKLPWVQSAISLPIQGRISVDGHIELGKYKWRKANGEINVTFYDTIIGDGKTKVSSAFLKPPKGKPGANFFKEGFPLPPLNLGSKFSWTIKIEKGTAEVKDFTTISEDGEMELVGNIKFREPVKLSNVNMYLKFKFSEKTKAKHDALQVMDLSLQKKGKRTDGYLGMSISGKLTRLKFKPRRRGLIDYGKYKKNGLSRGPYRGPSSRIPRRTRRGNIRKPPNNPRPKK
ncbi:MAG: type II secretion system protein GspN [Deltaproteobacteria bacterium]|jgi:type II secretion system protein N|nr:type II secretion system protein GspN [Deltaproteobacteria bacterium]